MDFPPDTYMHMLVHGVDLPNLKTCLITHTHDDHFYWEDLKMRCDVFANNLDSVPFSLYGNDEFVRRMEAVRQMPNGGTRTSGIAWHELPAFHAAQIEGYTITPLLAHHNPRERCYNYILEKEDQRIFYGHDTGPFLSETWDFLERWKKRFSLVTLDCTMLVLSQEHLPAARRTHMNIDACCETRARMLRMGCADERTIFVINHFSHNGAICADGRLMLHEELEEYMSERGFQVAYDGKVLDF